MTKKIKFKKGNCILAGAIWYIVVDAYYEDGNVYFNCICDHANNTHTWSIKDIEEVFDTKDIGYKQPKYDREVPYMVIAEVLAGQHDDKFSDYCGDEND